MIRREAGFTLVELIITMAIFVFVIAAASQVFTGLLTQFKQQSKIAETNIEGIVGLDIMRRDIENAGFGLPWILNGATYCEALDGASTVQNETVFNDTNTDCSVSNSPRAYVSGDSAGVSCQSGVCSDVLVIKATNVAQNDTSQKWTYVSPGNTVKEWDILGERLANNDRVIVLSLADSNRRGLILSGGNFTTRYNSTTTPDSLVNSAFAPLDTTDPRIVYGVDDPAAGTALRMPFNRGDYYVDILDSGGDPVAPSRCATGTGVLYKGNINQSSTSSLGGGLTGLPLLDCVADMQVYYRLDTNNDGTIDSELTSIALLTAQNIRNQVREIRVYILAHEGQRDGSYTFNNFTGASTCATCVRVGQSAALGRDFNLATITDYLNYRWKVYTIVVQPKNLR